MLRHTLLIIMACAVGTLLRAQEPGRPNGVPTPASPTPTPSTVGVRTEPTAPTTIALPVAPDARQPHADVDSMARRMKEAANQSLYEPTERTSAAGLSKDVFSYDYARSGTLATNSAFSLAGMGSRTTMPGLMTRQSAALTALFATDNLMLSGGVTADRYMLVRGLATVYGVNASATLRINDAVSVTLFGRFYNDSPYFSMAAMPYVGSSAYGGFVSMKGERMGIDLGVERVYDPFAGRWTTVPIVTPSVQLGRRLTVSLPMGWLVKDAIDNVVRKDGVRQSPTIMAPSAPLLRPTIEVPRSADRY